MDSRQFHEYRPAVIPGKPQLGIIERFFVQGYVMIAERNITSQMATLGECDGLCSLPHTRRSAPIAVRKNIHERIFGSVCWPYLFDILPMAKARGF